MLGSIQFPGYLSVCFVLCKKLTHFHWENFLPSVWLQIAFTPSSPCAITLVMATQAFMLCLQCMQPASCMVSTTHMLSKLSVCNWWTFGVCSCVVKYPISTSPLNKETLTHALISNCYLTLRRNMVLLGSHSTLQLVDCRVICYDGPGLKTEM